MEIDARLGRELAKKFEMEVDRREIEITENWKNELEALYRKKHESMGALNIEIRGLIERMNNRIRVLKSIVKEGS
jgi:hypothetical protein